MINLGPYSGKNFPIRVTQADGTYVGECGGFVERSWLYV